MGTQSKGVIIISSFLLPLHLLVAYVLHVGGHILHGQPITHAIGDHRIEGSPGVLPANAHTLKGPFEDPFQEATGTKRLKAAFPLSPLPSTIFQLPVFLSCQLSIVSCQLSLGCLMWPANAMRCVATRI